MALSGYLVWRIGGWATDKLVYENPAFSIRDIDLQTDGVIATEQLRRWANVKSGQNLLALDLGRVKRNLELVPFIQSVSVERILPHTLRIRVCEREPIAQMLVSRRRIDGAVEEAVYHLDSEGWAMSPLDPRQRATPQNLPPEQLPMLSGIKEAQAGHCVDLPQARAALQLIDAFDRSPMAGITELKKIDVSAAEVLVATTGQGGEVTFGLTDFEQQLRRWREIYERGQKNGKAVATLDLAVSNNIPATWIEASVVPPLPPKAPKVLRNKRKHV
ncbi:MAG TPA: FtsQ-type POTRA domain-containing protein [Verrucomicrobiae bacterium]